MDIKALLDDITRFASEPRFEEVAKAARHEHDRRVGVIYTDDITYEARMVNFMEWFVFDFAVDESGRTMLDRYMEESGTRSNGNLALLTALKNQTRDIFAVKWAYDGLVKLTALYLDQYIIVQDPERWEMFKKKDIFSGRAVNVEDKWYLTNGVCVHPSKTLRLLKKEMKKFRAAGNFNMREYQFTLTAMSVMWERSRNIDIHDIYKPVEF